MNLDTHHKTENGNLTTKELKMIINFELSLRIRLLVLSVLLLTQLGMLKSQCDCVIKEIDKEVSLVTEIFIGRVLGKKINHQKHTRLSTLMEIGGIQNEIEVIKIIKGNLSIKDTIKILTGGGKNDCGYDFELNQFYLIYSRYRFTDNCRRTKIINNFSDEEIKYLLADTSNSIRPPLLSKDYLSLSEKQYSAWRQNPVLTLEECEKNMGLQQCYKEAMRKLTSYFDTEISERKVKQLIVLKVDDGGLIFEYSFYPRKGELSKDEEDKLIVFIKNNYRFFTQGYGEIINGGMTTLLLEN